MGALQGEVTTPVWKPWEVRVAKSGKQLSVAVKMVLVSACFSLPIIVLAYFVISNIGDNITFAKMEMAGNTYQAPLEQVMKGVLEHQRFVHDCPVATEGCAGKVAAAEDTVRQGFTALEAADQSYGKTLEFTSEGLAKRGRQLATVAHLEESWKSVTSGLSAAKGVPDAALAAKYDEVLGTASTMITHLGDTSELILDPELDTYHFVVNTLNTLPQNQQRTAHMIATARDAFAHGQFSIEDRTALAIHAAQLQAMDIDQSTGDTQTALHENGNEFHGAVDSFQKEIPPVFKDWSESNAKLAAATKSLATDVKPAMTFEQYSALAAKAQDDSFRFWDVGARNLNTLLQMRIAYYENRRTVSLLLSGLALVMSCFMAFLVTRSMVVPLNKLALTLTPGATLLVGSIRGLSDASEKGVQDPEMIRIICGELSAHADDMRETAQSLERLVFGSVKQTNESSEQPALAKSQRAGM